VVEVQVQFLDGGNVIGVRVSGVGRSLCAVSDLLHRVIL